MQYQYQTITVKFVCKVCKQEKEREIKIKIPIVCSKECRSKNFADCNRERFRKLRELKTQAINGQNTGSEDTNNLGQTPTGENRVDTPPEPTENTGGI